MINNINENAAQLNFINKPNSKDALITTDSEAMKSKSTGTEAPQHSTRQYVNDTPKVAPAQIEKKTDDVDSLIATIEDSQKLSKSKELSAEFPINREELEVLETNSESHKEKEMINGMIDNFSTIDANHDGLISLDEKMAYSNGGE